MNLFEGPGSDCGHCICGVSFSLGGHFDARWSHADGFDYCCRECAEGSCMCSVIESTLRTLVSPRLDALLERLERPLTPGRPGSRGTLDTNMSSQPSPGFPQ